MLSFLNFGIIDVIDIFLVAYLFYQFYLIIRDTVAINIFVVIVAVYFIWLMVKALNMQLLSTILGHIMGVGVIALFIVFQQEIRRFLLMIGTKYTQTSFSFSKLFAKIRRQPGCKMPIDEIIKACEYMKKNNIGALIVLTDKDQLASYAQSGEIINSEVKALLLETIFYKNTPLHDGAVIIHKNKILAAGCILPLTERTDLPYYLGLRHRAAIGITENTDALAIVISEERAEISYAEFGRINLDVGLSALQLKIMEKFYK